MLHGCELCCITLRSKRNFANINIFTPAVFQDNSTLYQSVAWTERRREKNPQRCAFPLDCQGQNTLFVIVVGLLRHGYSSRFTINKRYFYPEQGIAYWVYRRETPRVKPTRSGSGAVLLTLRVVLVHLKYTSTVEYC